jgi:hypothetical protein
METELRELLAKYGTSEVHKGLMKMMRDDYIYLRGIFEKKQVQSPCSTNETVTPEAVVIPKVMLKEENLPPGRIDENGVKHLVVKTKKKGAEEVVSFPTVEATEEKQEDDKKIYRDAKAIKQYQLDAEQKKRSELDAKGITVESLLTRENLETWISKEGMTYAAVAREHVGCSSDLVATTAKAFGIKSSNSKKRSIFIARKKAS